VEGNFGSYPGNCLLGTPPDQHNGELRSTEHLTWGGHRTCSSHCCGTCLQREIGN